MAKRNPKTKYVFLLITLALLTSLLFLVIKNYKNEITSDEPTAAPVIENSNGIDSTDLNIDNSGTDIFTTPPQDIPEPNL